MDFLRQKFSHRFVYMAAPGGPAPAPGGPAAPPPPPPGGAPAAAPAVAPAAVPAADLNTLVANAPSLSAEVKRRARQALMSEENTLYKEQLVEKLLSSRNSKEFLAELDELEDEEESWGNITKKQRSVRGKIRALHEEAKSHREILTPAEDKTRESERSTFTNYLDSVGALNSKDKNLDSSLRNMLHGATQQNVLTHAQAEEIYLLDSKMPNFESRFKNLTNGLRNVNGGPAFIERLHALKLQEYTVEREFQRLYDALQLIVQRNISRAKREADKKRAFEIASRTVGIRLKEGTAIRVEDPGNLVVPPETKTVHITRVKFEEIPIRDHGGKIVGYSIGFPRVTINNGADMPLSRFKKWVDAQNAVEEVKTKNELEEKMGISELGLHIKEGDELEYSFMKKEQNELKRETRKVSIRRIHDGKIEFYSPVSYQTGIALAEEGVPTETRDSLEFGEFLKWYLQNSAFLSIGLDELKKNLRAYNQNFNRAFGVSSGDNPPIEAVPGETLIYPDGSGRSFNIKNVSKDKIEMDNMPGMTFPQFFLWVKNNNVKKAKPGEVKGPQKDIKLPDTKAPKVETPEETAAREKRESDERMKATKPESLSALEAVKEFWHHTTFLSMNDIWNMGVAIKDFVKRRHERRSKDRYSGVGSNLPGLLGAEFEKIKHAAENEEVNQFKEAMEHWSIEKVKDTLHHTTNKDVAKAAIMTLTHKGEMRWDDPHFWETLNILTAKYTMRGATLFIPDEHKLKLMGKSGEDMTQPACDALWGDGSWHEWFEQNINTYNTKKKAFEYKGKQLEADPKGTDGLRGELERLLKTWKAGKYVSPHEYEEMIDFAIKYGKMSAEAKMFYLIAGCVARNPHTGETLLHLDRPGDLNGQYLNAFPLLDFFTDKSSLKPTMGPDGNMYMKARPWNLKDYEYWIRHEFPDDFRAGRPGAQFSSFMWRTMMPNENFRTRLSKGLRKAEEMDHDDAHLFIPPSATSEIMKLVGTPGGGQKTFFTNEGYRNGYPGFNQYLVALSFSAERAEGEEKKKSLEAMKEAIKSFLLYDATLTNRYKKSAGDQYARLSDFHFNRMSVVDNSALPRLHQKQMRNLIRTVGKLYGKTDEEMSYILDKETKSMQVESERNEQGRIESEIEQFLKFMDESVTTQGAEKILQAVQEARIRDAQSDTSLRGMRGWTLGKSKPEEFLNIISGKKPVNEMSESELWSGYGGGGHH